MSRDLTSAPDAADEGLAKPFLDHLEDLRIAIFRCIVTLAIGFAVAIPLTPVILRLLQAPLHGIVEDPRRFLRTLEVAGAFNILMRVGTWTGLVLCAPVLLLWITQFVFPGLTPRERMFVRRTLVFSAGLFALGVVLGYHITTGMALRWMFGLNQWLGLEPEWTATSYVSFVMGILIAFGLAFQLPVVVLFLGYLGVVTPPLLRKYRRHVLVGLLLLAMFLTPPDIISQIMMAIPLAVLYEITIWVLAASLRARRREAAAAEAEPP